MRCFLWVLIFQFIFQADSFAADCRPTVRALSARDVPLGTTVWKVWNCPSCNTEGISARPDKAGRVACANCGRPRDPSDPKAVFYDSHGPGLVGAEDIASSSSEAEFAKTAKMTSCDHCGGEVLWTGEVGKCSGCGASVTTAAPKLRRPTERPDSPKPKYKRWILGAAGVVAVTAGVLH